MSAIVNRQLQGITPGASQAVAVGATSTPSSAVADNTQAVLLTSTVPCFVSVGSSPTAAANSSLYLAANVPTVVAVSGGWKVAAIQASSSGTLYLTECA